MRSEGKTKMTEALGNLQHRGLVQHKGESAQFFTVVTALLLCKSSALGWSLATQKREGVCKSSHDHDKGQVEADTGSWVGAHINIDEG